MLFTTKIYIFIETAYHSAQGYLGNLIKVLQVSVGLSTHKVAGSYLVVGIYMCGSYWQVGGYPRGGYFQELYMAKPNVEEIPSTQHNSRISFLSKDSHYAVHLLL